MGVSPSFGCPCRVFTLRLHRGRQNPCTASVLRTTYVALDGIEKEPHGAASFREEEMVMKAPIEVALQAGGQLPGGARSTSMASRSSIFLCNTGP